MCGSSGQESCNAQFDQLPLHEWESSSEGSDYDFQSVMHYGKLPKLRTLCENNSVQRFLPLS